MFTVLISAPTTVRVGMYGSATPLELTMWMCRNLSDVCKNRRPPRWITWCCNKKFVSTHKRLSQLTQRFDCAESHRTATTSAELNIEVHRAKTPSGESAPAPRCRGIKSRWLTNLSTTMDHQNSNDQHSVFLGLILLLSPHQHPDVELVCSLHGTIIVDAELWIPDRWLVRSRSLLIPSVY